VGGRLGGGSFRADALHGAPAVLLSLGVAARESPSCRTRMEDSNLVRKAGHSGRCLSRRPSYRICVSWDSFALDEDGDSVITPALDYCTGVAMRPIFFGARAQAWAAWPPASEPFRSRYTIACGARLPTTWKNGASDVGADQDLERYRVKVALQAKSPN